MMACAPSVSRPGIAGQMVRFACIGVASTVAYTVLYLGLRDAGVIAQAANAISLLLTALANTAANRRLTFAVEGRAGRTRHLLQGLIAFGAGLALTAPALAIVHLISARPAHRTEVAALIAASLLATAVRFVLYRWWVFRG